MPQVVLLKSSSESDDQDIWKSQILPAAVHIILKDHAFSVMAIQHDFDKLEFDFPVENVQVEKRKEGSEYLKATVNKPVTIEQISSITEEQHFEWSNLWFYIGPITSPSEAFENVFYSLTMEGKDPNSEGEAVGLIADGERLVWWIHEFEENSEEVKSELKKLAKKFDLVMDIV